MKKKNLRNIIDDDSVDNIEKFRKLSIEANKNVHNDKKRSFTLSPDEDDNEMRVLSYKMPYSLDISTMDSSSNMNHSNGSNNNNNNNCHDNNDENKSNNDWKSSSSVNDNDNNNHDDSNNDNNNHNNNNHDNNNNDNNNDSNNHDNSQVFTSSLNPFRKPDILPIEIFDLLKSQKYFIEGIQYKQLIERTSNSIVQNISNSLFPSFQGNSLLSSIGSNNSLSYSELLHSRQHVQHTQTLEYVKRFSNFDYSEILWGDSEARSKVLALTNIISVNSLGDDLKSVTSTSTSTSAIGNGNGNGIADSGKERGRARSVGKGRKMIRSNSKASTSGTGTGPSGTCPNGVSRNRSRTRTSSYDRTDQENRNENDSNELNEQRRRQLSSSFSASKDRGLDSTLDDDGVIIKDFYDNQKLKNSLHRNLSILTTLPSNILKMIDDGVGCVEGVWFTSHPLAPMPLTVIESLLAVTGHKKQGAILSNEKQMTWQLDILRDSDEQKMIRYENYLSTKRNPLIEDQLKNRLQILNKPQSNSSNLQKNTKKVKSVILNDYYRDKGRQANK